MLETVQSASLVGIRVQRMQVGVAIGRGTPSIQVVGLAASAVREGRQRIRAATGRPHAGGPGPSGPWRWRPESAWTADGVTDWLPELLRWLREAGVEEVTVRLDKGFCAERVVRTLQELEVSYLLEVATHGHVRDQLGSWRESSRAEGNFEEAETIHTNFGRLRGDRLLSLEGRRPLQGEEALHLDTWPDSEGHRPDLDEEPAIPKAAPRASAVGPAPRNSITGAPTPGSAGNDPAQHDSRSDNR